MRLFNTLSGKVEEIKPLNPPTVTISMPGPPTLNYPNISDWFTFVRCDILMRALELSNFTPQLIVNNNDVTHIVSDDSAARTEYFAETIDIHACGIDHAKSIAGKPYANVRMETNHVTFDDDDSSAPADNHITLEHVADKGISLAALRLHVLESHYRSRSAFSWKSLRAAQERLNNICAWADLRWQPGTDVMPNELDELFRTTREDIRSALQNDLNTPRALVVLSKLIDYMWTIPIPGVDGKHTNGTLAFLDAAFGLELGNRKDISDEQKQLVREREAARTAQDWVKSDDIRNQLAQQDLGLRDTTYQGAIWYRL